MKKYIILILLVFILSGCNRQKPVLVRQVNNPTNNDTNETTTQIPEETNTELKKIKPIAEFDTRITKKPFGIYITPQNSPVQPEKFTGYHTGVDIEYGDLEKEITVIAIADGEVLRSGWVSGYGGMLAIKHSISSQDYIVIYGHLKSTSLVKNKSLVKAGDTIAVLGDGYSHDTNNERKHLHFAIYTGADINVKGYVKSQTELQKWLDPIEFFK
jgi:murein DD-endopeptidase MepM/ murein hydrolase activator NlpD